MMAGDFPLIRCPYCFSEFKHTQVCFKAKTVFTEQDLEEQEADAISDYSQYSIGRATAQKNLRRRFFQSEDVIRQNFWKDYPGSEPEWEYGDHAVITPKDTELMENGKSYGRDAGGFVDHVVDCFQKKSTARICPHCHNRLPRGYGKFPVYFIAVVGAVYSGKTVYLSQLMKHLDSRISEIGMAAFREDGIDAFLSKNPVERGSSLPGSTPPEHLSEPLFYLIGGERQSFHLVFYDIAGENCADAEKMEKFGPFIRNADGILLLLDPEQFPQLCDAHNPGTVEPESVIRTMRSSFISSESRSGKWDTPVAVVLTKSDKLKYDGKIVPVEASFRDDILYEDRKYDRSVSQKADSELRNIFSRIQRGNLLIRNLDACFENYAFFAVSMLEHGDRKVITDSGEERSQPNGSPDTVRIEEPLFWILDQYGLIPAQGEKRAGHKSWWAKWFWG